MMSIHQDGLNSDSELRSSLNAKYREPQHATDLGHRPVWKTTHQDELNLDSEQRSSINAKYQELLLEIDLER